MWETAFDHFLARLIVRGELRVTYPDGSVRSYGDGHGLRGEINIHDSPTLRRLCLHPELAFGEAYMDESVTIGDCELEDVVGVILRNLAAGHRTRWWTTLEKFRFFVRGYWQRNTAATARCNVAHHYDISDDFYRLMLDADMQYSCAYFRDPDMTLEEAQTAKKAHIAAKLRLEPGLHVLDIGCGWGGMALTLAREHGARVTGVTLSENQLATAQARAQAAGLEDQITFRLMDYRALDQRFDRIVSVGMLEHVGAPQLSVYFDKVSHLLNPDGVALIHTIGRNGRPKAQSAWLNKYIFPGGYVPSLTEVVEPISRGGMWALDIESWRLHYALTLRHWLARFEDNLNTVRQMYDDRFVRMWRFYLVACLKVFEEVDQTVFQIQLGHKPDAVPLTRDYMYRDTNLQARAAE